MAIHTPPTGPISPAAASNAVARSEPLATWRVGQVLAATVASSPQSGITDLRIGRLLVKAQTGDLQLSAGQNLRLEVASLKQMPVLKLLGILQQNPIQQAMREVLPQQQPLPLLFRALAQLALPATAQRSSTLAPDILQLGRELLAKLPDLARVSTADGLRQAIRDSGLFLESKLAQTAAQPQMPQARPDEIARDFKANLLRLVQVIRDNVASSAPATTRANPLTDTTTTAATTAPAAATTTAAKSAASPALPAALAAALATRLSAGAGFDPAAPLQRGMPPPQIALEKIVKNHELALTRSELQRFAEGALARVQLNQLSSLPQERTPLPEWLIELPLRRDNETDIWGLRLSQDAEQDRGNPTDTTPSWSMMLSFDLPGLGPMQSRVTLRGERVTAQFFSHTQGVLPVLVEHLPLLQARLQQVGLLVEELSCHHGEIPQRKQPPPTRMLDERA